MTPSYFQTGVFDKPVDKPIAAMSDVLLGPGLMGNAGHFGRYGLRLPFN
jgi:hypothetical protein